MVVFELPSSTKVGRVIPKNAFDNYSSPKYKRLFKDLVARITWTHKLSPETINLEGRDLKELQILKIELKRKEEEIKSILDVIDKAIPYHIIFVIEHDGSFCVSTSPKHLHPSKVDSSVIDWTFRSDWFDLPKSPFDLKLKKSIDAVYYDFCLQLSGTRSIQTESLQDLLAHLKKVRALEAEISRFKSSMAKSKQFNHKVEINQQLKAAERELEQLLGGGGKGSN